MITSRGEGGRGCTSREGGTQVEGVSHVHCILAVITPHNPPPRKFKIKEGKTSINRSDITNHKRLVPAQRRE